MPPVEESNSKFRNIIQIALPLLVLFYMVVDRMIVPQVSASKIADTLALEVRIAKAETTMEYVKLMLDKIDRKLEQHVGK